jgi:hypothetical protein
VEDIVNLVNPDLEYHRKYKTLDPSSRVRASGDPGNYNSLERGTRRKLPTVPNNVSQSLNTHSLPRPPKHHPREQSDSRSRERYFNQYKFVDNLATKKMRNHARRPLRNHATLQTQSNHVT